MLSHLKIWCNDRWKRSNALRRSVNAVMLLPQKSNEQRDATMIRPSHVERRPCSSVQSREFLHFLQDGHICTYDWSRPVVTRVHPDWGSWRSTPGGQPVKPHKGDGTGWKAPIRKTLCAGTLGQVTCGHHITGCFFVFFSLVPPLKILSTKKLI